ncbi:MAG: hypothetical protein JRN09_02930 [Nitrososphaerota archaeon]|jgi:hypothetical protein|nr:hypothetical protein [Nitrososphaerota archaeon]
MLLQNWWYITLTGTTLPMEPSLKGDEKCGVPIIGGGAAGEAGVGKTLRELETANVDVRVRGPDGN